jgi:hypothetical protein
MLINIRAIARPRSLAEHKDRWIGTCSSPLLPFWLSSCPNKMDPDTLSLITWDAFQRALLPRHPAAAPALSASSLPSDPAEAHTSNASTAAAASEATTASATTARAAAAQAATISTAATSAAAAAVEATAAAAAAVGPEEAAAAARAATAIEEKAAAEAASAAAGGALTLYHYNGLAARGHEHKRVLSKIKVSALDRHTRLSTPARPLA